MSAGEKLVVPIASSIFATMAALCSLEILQGKLTDECIFVLTVH